MVNKMSVPTPPSTQAGSMNLFTVPTTDINISAYRMSPYDEWGSGITPMEFVISGVDEFVDLSPSYIKLELALDTPAATHKGIYADGQATGHVSDASDADYTKYIYPVNNFAHSIIRQKPASQRHAAQPSDGHVRLQSLH